MTWKLAVQSTHCTKLIFPSFARNLVISDGICTIGRVALASLLIEVYVCGQRAETPWNKRCGAVKLSSASQLPPSNWISRNPKRSEERNAAFIYCVRGSLIQPHSSAAALLLWPPAKNKNKSDVGRVFRRARGCQSRCSTDVQLGGRAPAAASRAAAAALMSEIDSRGKRGRGGNLYIIYRTTAWVRIGESGTHHFLDLSLGGGFLGMRKSARIGCMSHRAAKRMHPHRSIRIQRNKAKLRLQNSQKMETFYGN